MAVTSGTCFNVFIDLRDFATLGAVGYAGRFEYSAIGSVVNLAARLCAEAHAGRFAIEPLPPLTLKGFDRPVAAFRLLGLDRR